MIVIKKISICKGERALKVSYLTLNLFYTFLDFKSFLSPFKVMVIDVGTGILISVSVHSISLLGYSCYLKKKNTVDQELVGGMNRKQVVLVGPLFCTSHQSQGPLVCLGQCC